MMVIMIVMKHARRAIRDGLGRVCVVGGVVFMLGACTSPEFDFHEFTAGGIPETPVSAMTPQERYPITVEAVRTAIELSGRDGSERLTATEIRRVDEIVTAFAADSRGQLIISVPAAASTDPRILGRAKQIADRAKRRGVTPSRILLRVDTGDQRANGPVVISFETLVVRVAECGDWSKESSHDPMNADYINFGCALQRNIGLMIASPADLIAPRTAGLRDTARSNIVIQQYRAGAVTGAARAAAEQATAIGTD